MRKFELQLISASNLNALFGSTHPLADSDGDGLSDDAEAKLGTDPTNPDTDGDGYGDGVEALLPGSLNPTTANPGCESRVDTDQDGLLDCEEAAAGTLPNNPDSNGNFIPDRIEFLGQAAAVVDDPKADADRDGIPDDQELLLHLPVKTPNSSQEVTQWGYTYRSTPTTTNAAGSQCYSLGIGNIAMYQTLAAGGAPMGHNLVQVILPFAPPDGAGPVQFYRALLPGNFQLPDHQLPSNGSFTLTQDLLKKFP